MTTRLNWLGCSPHKGVVPTGDTFHHDKDQPTCNTLLYFLTWQGSLSLRVLCLPCRVYLGPSDPWQAQTQTQSFGPVPLGFLVTVCLSLVPAPLQAPWVRVTACSNPGELHPPPPPPQTSHHPQKPWERGQGSSWVMPAHRGEGEHGSMA